MGKEHFCFFQTAETGNRTPNSGVKGSGANHYPRAPALWDIIDIERFKVELASEIIDRLENKCDLWDLKCSIITPGVILLNLLPRINLSKYYTLTQRWFNAYSAEKY